MLDTTVFNHLVDGSISSCGLPTAQQLFVTHVQLNEIQSTSDPARLQILLAMFTTVGSTRVPTASAVWDVSEYGEAEWGSKDGFFESLLVKLNDKNKSKSNNARDILIAETAIRNNLVLVTDDRDLAEIVREAGGAVIGLAEFLFKQP